MTKKIFFNNISIQNFLSIGNTPVNIDFRNGLHVITGINKDQSDRRNGIGKSTILDALSFVLFGSTLRDLKKEFIINNITKSTSKISLSFTVCNNNIQTNYVIIRTIEPNKCFLYENGVDITRDSMVNTTEFVLKLLNITQEVFQNCIAMSINSTVPFMAKKAIDKRKFIESIFNLEIFSKMNTGLKADMQNAKKEFDIVNGRLEEVVSSLQTINSQIKLQEQERDNRKKTLTTRLEDHTKDLSKLSAQIQGIHILNIDNVEDKIKEAEEKNEGIKTKINETGKIIVQLETKRDFIKSNLLKIGTDKDACPVCLKKITDSDTQHIESEKKKIEKDIISHQSIIDTTTSKLEVYQASNYKLHDAIKKLKSIVSMQQLQREEKKHLKHKETDLIKSIETVEKDLNDIDVSSNNYIISTQELQQKFNTLEQESVKYKSELEILDVVKFILSEDGVRSYIVKKILALFNGKLSIYLRKLNSNAIITFNEYFEESITNSKGTPVSYFNFSGAEKKVIDLAIMFTFIEMLRMQSNIGYNVQFYDELLDTSLDEAGVEMVVSLLGEIVGKFDCGVYIISHRKECSKLSTGDVIFLEKKEGITTRIPYLE